MRNKLTDREVALAAIAAAFGSMFLGAIAALLLDRLTTFWDALSAVAALIASAVTLAALLLAVRGYRQSQKTHQAEFRAYLGYDAPKIETITNGTCAFTFHLKNYGRTPAKSVFMATNVGILSPHLEHAFIAAEITEYGEGIIHPGIQSNVIVTIENIDVAEIITRQKVIYVNLMVNYIDVFDQSHTTRQSYFLNHESLEEMEWTVWDKFVLVT